MKIAIELTAAMDRLIFAYMWCLLGFLFRNGRIERPVSGMLVTGNFLKLWHGLIAAGDDARPCLSKLIPTVGFADVDFSG